MNHIFLHRKLQILWIFPALLFMHACKKNNVKNSNLSKTPLEGKVLLFEVLNDSLTGISFTNKLHETLEMNALNYDYMYNGAGVSAGDFNNDGLEDLYFVSNQENNKLYINKGNLKFDDVTSISQVQGFPGFELASTVVDINSDGLLDIYICRSGPFNADKARENKLYINKGINKYGIPIFEEQAEKYGLNLPHYSTQASFFDYDKDGDLDMFLINHNTDTKVLYDLDNERRKKSPLTSDRLFRNDNNKFVDVSNETGILNDGIGFGLGIGIGDLNNDTWPDVLVSQDFASHDRIYLNQKNGTFIEVSKEATGHMSNFSMGNDIADFNNDGWLDFMTLDMVSEDNYGIKASMSGMNPEKFNELLTQGFHYQYMYNTLQVNNGNISHDSIPIFSDIASLSGVSSTDWSWGPLFFDMDNDGDKDLFISNGIKRDFRNVDYIHFKQKIEAEYEKKIREAPNNLKGLLERQRDEIILRKMPPRKKDNYFYENKSNLTFEKKNNLWCKTLLTASNGATYADLDNDGDLEIITNNMDDKAHIYKNNAVQLGKGNFLKVIIKGSKKNTNGLGARVILKADNQIQVLEQYYSRGFQSSKSGPLHFGLGDVKIIQSLKICWPDGKVQELENISGNKTITLKNSEAHFPQKKLKRNQDNKIVFQNVTKEKGIKHFSHQNKFNDFKRESLLPHKMSEDKLALCIGDVNNDGLEDFFIGGASGYEATLYVQNKLGTFNKKYNTPFKKDKIYEDTDATFFDADNDGDLDLYVVSGSNEFNKDSNLYSDRLYINKNGHFHKSSTTLPKDLNFSGSVVRPHDFDQDGDIDLFIGGRQTPGGYPLSGTSLLLRNESIEGLLKFSLINNNELSEVGMVTDAKWEDINGDNFKELILVGEWMPLTIFKNQKGILKKNISKTNLNDNVGWWFSLESGDFDNDGDIDFVAGNLGLNSKYQASKEEPFQIFAKDFDQTGTVDIVLSYEQNGVNFPLRGRECSSQQMPFIKQKFKNYHEFALADLETVYGKENIKSALNFKATNFSSSFFENLGGGNFKISPLRNEAQTTTVRSLVSGDFNKDGDLDMLLFGNLYGFEVETPRQDSGFGLYLESVDGKLNKILNNNFFVNGEVLNAKKIRIEGNKLGILVLRNNNDLQLFKIK